jgi:hypothetical protein
MLYVDTALTMSIFNSQAEMRDAVFRMLFDLVKDMEDSFSERLIVLGFSNILSFSVNSQALPPLIQSNLMAMFQQVIRELVLLEEEANEEDEEGNHAEDDDDEEDGQGIAAMMTRNGHRSVKKSSSAIDDDEDVTEESSSNHRQKKSSKSQIPDEGFDEEEDAVNEDDLQYLALLAKLEKQDRVKAELRRANGKIAFNISSIRYSSNLLPCYDAVGGEPVDDEEDELEELMFDSPIEKLDLVVYFLDAMQAGYLREPQLVSSLQQGLDEEDKQRLQTFMQSLNERRAQQQT